MVPDVSAINPHAAGGLATAGPAPEQAAGALILLHGRGASAEGMLDLFSQLAVPTLAALAPRAAGR